MQPADAPFIFRAWLEGSWPYSGAPLIMTKSEWLPRWHKVIESLLDAPNVGCLVAHVNGKPESLLGFAASGHGCLHWLYTKQAFRNLGVATEMIRRLNLQDKICSFWTPKLSSRGWTYDPRFLRAR